MMGKHRVKFQSAQIDPNDINVQKINTDCNSKFPDLQIPKGTRIPSLSTNMIGQFLDKLQKTAVGPDDYLLRRRFTGYTG